jgi:leader peptidase (prepilin peptidase) / N-methyltransferase
VVALRLPKAESLNGRSHCPTCGATIRWYQNIPVLSFLVLRGKCAYCRGSISWQYPLVESAGALLLAVAYATYGTKGDWLSVGTFAIFALFGLAMFLTDILFGVLPDQLTITGAVAVFILNILRGSDWRVLVVSAVGAAAFFWVQRLVSRGTWVGEGDVRLGAWLGAGLGWPGVLVALSLAYASGALVGLGLVVTGRAKWQSHVPFGTFLTVAGLATWLWGAQLVQAYIGFVGAI